MLADTATPSARRFWGSWPLPNSLTPVCTARQSSKSFQNTTPRKDGKPARLNHSRAVPPSLTLPTSQKEYPGRFWGLRPPPDPGHLLDADAGEPARRSPIYRCRERPPSPWFRSFRPTWSPPSPKQRAPGGLAPSLPEVAPELTQMAAARSQARCPLSAFQHVSVSAFPLTAPAAASAQSSAA